MLKLSLMLKLEDRGSGNNKPTNHRNEEEKKVDNYEMMNSHLT